MSAPEKVQVAATIPPRLLDVAATAAYLGGVSEWTIRALVADGHLRPVRLPSGRAVLDVVREVRPPFSPEATVAEFAQTFKTYGLTEVTSDRYAGSWPVEAFRKVGITVKPSERTRSDIYLAALPMIMSGQVEIPDHPRLLKQLGSLERKKGRQGKDSVDAPPRQHEDVANSACGALVLAGLSRTREVIVHEAIWG